MEDTYGTKKDISKGFGKMVNNMEMELPLKRIE